MKTIIAGSRSLTDYDIVERAMTILSTIFKPEITTIISGHARGIDKLGEQWGLENNIPLMVFPAEWDKFGKRAGFLRNKEMVDNADLLVAIMQGQGTKGTLHTIKEMKKSRKLYIVFHVWENSITIGDASVSLNPYKPDII